MKPSCVGLPPVQVICTPWPRSCSVWWTVTLSLEKSSYGPLWPVTVTAEPAAASAGDVVAGSGSSATSSAASSAALPVTARRRMCRTWVIAALPCDGCVRRAHAR